MKIVLLIPCYNNARNLRNAFASYYKLDPQPDRYIFCENNSRDDTARVIVREFRRPKRLIRFWLRDDISTKGENPYLGIATARQLLLEAARKEDPDFAIFMDSDIYVKTPAMIEMLTAWDKDIVGGIYWRAYPEGIYIASKWPSSITGKYFMRKWPEFDNQVGPGLNEVAMTSGGCLCLSRRIIQDKRINFFPLYDRDPQASEDYGYCLQARDFGYKTYLDLRFIDFQKLNIIEAEYRRTPKIAKTREEEEALLLRRVKMINLLDHDIKANAHKKSWTMVDGKYLPFTFDKGLIHPTPSSG